MMSFLNLRGLANPRQCLLIGQRKSCLISNSQQELLSLDCAEEPRGPEEGQVSSLPLTTSPFSLVLSSSLIWPIQPHSLASAVT